MAYHKFIQSIMNGRTISVYGDGKQIRSTTYVDDCVSATISAALANPRGSEFNISGGEPIELMNAISEIEAQLGMKAKINFHPSQPGDQKTTISVSEKAKLAFGFEPKFSFKEGISRQIDWQRGLTQDYVMEV
jgi:UDP-glucose 4-epimerase